MLSPIRTQSRRLHFPQSNHIYFLLGLRVGVYISPSLMNGERSLGRLRTLSQVSQLGGGKQTFVWGCRLHQSEPLPWAASLSFGFDFDESVLFAAVWWVSGWKVIGWCPGWSQCPPGPALPAGTLFPGGCTVGWGPRLAGLFSGEVHPATSLISGAASRKPDQGQGGPSAADHMDSLHRIKISIHPEKRAGFRSSATIFIHFSHTICLESVGTYSSRKSTDYFFKVFY